MSNLTNEREGVIKNIELPEPPPIEGILEAMKQTTKAIDLFRILYQNPWMINE